jgi:D-serine deaminase-like pyridoxal phosphate-dependent protein
MRVFVSGATGVIGRRVVPALLAEGHQVTAALHTLAKAAALGAIGARVRQVDLFDPDELRTAVFGHDAIVNLATHIPHSTLGAFLPSAWHETDHIRREGVANLAAAAEAAGVRLDVYVEVDVGARRCGVPPGEAALELAREIAARPALRFAGLQAYHGAAQHLRAMGERRAAIESAARAARETRLLIESAGIACPTVTGGGSGSFAFEIESRVFDEIQPGSYVFMDADYAKNEWAAPLPRFEHALFVLSTVMSRPTPARAVLDAGLKASSVDSGLPVVWQRPGFRYARASDEHGVLEIDSGATAPALGEKLLLVPGHCDPTVNLYDWYVCVRGGVVEALWPISARGALY